MRRYLEKENSDFVNPHDGNSFRGFLHRLISENYERYESENLPTFTSRGAFREAGSPEIDVSFSVTTRDIGIELGWTPEGFRVGCAGLSVAYFKEGATEVEVSKTLAEKTVFDAPIWWTLAPPPIFYVEVNLAVKIKVEFTYSLHMGARGAAFVAVRPSLLFPSLFSCPKHLTTDDIQHWIAFTCKPTAIQELSGKIAITALKA